MSTYEEKLRLFEDNLIGNYESIRDKIERQTVATEKNIKYFDDNKQILRKIYLNKFLIIHDENIVAVSDDIDDARQKWLNLVDVNNRFEAIIKHVQAENIIFI